LIGSYTGSGLAGTPTVRSPTTGGTTSALTARVNELSSGMGLGGGGSGGVWGGGGGGGGGGGVGGVWGGGGGGGGGGV
jgi:hypothetical protein